MIRRDWPLGAEAPERWFLIRQMAHARLSFELAQAWGGPNVPPLFCSADELDHPLASAREELLQAVFHHDNGWQEWGLQPHIDPKHLRPYGFMEMPTVDSQRIWNDSIQQCREIGPLAGWSVAAHFSSLHTDDEEDYVQWQPWLSRTASSSDVWLAEWLAHSSAHTKPLAKQALGWLQAFDWMSLWLCFMCPVAKEDALCEPLVVGGELLGGETGWPKIEFTPAELNNGNGNNSGSREIRVSPWPFIEQELVLRVEADSVLAKGYHNLNAQDKETQTIVWRLLP